MHRKISQTMQNFAWCAKFIFFYILWFRRVCEILHSVWNCPSLSPAALPPLDFACFAKFSHRHAKLLHVGFLPLVFFLAPSLAKAMKCSITRILHVFELQLALPWIAQNSPSFFACFNDKKATKNTKTSQKLISNPC